MLLGEISYYKQQRAKKQRQRERRAWAINIQNSTCMNTPLRRPRVLSHLLCMAQDRGGDAYSESTQSWQMGERKRGGGGCLLTGKMSAQTTSSPSRAATPPPAAQKRHSTNARRNLSFRIYVTKLAASITLGSSRGAVCSAPQGLSGLRESGAGYLASQLAGGHQNSPRVHGLWLLGRAIN